MTTQSELENARDDAKTLIDSDKAPLPSDAADKKQKINVEVAKEDEKWKKKAAAVSNTGVLVAGVAIIVLGFAVTRHQPDKEKPPTFEWDVHGLDEHTWPLVFATLVTAISLLVISWFGPGTKNGGLVGMFVGKDNRLSTSKFQMTVWTIVIVYAMNLFVGQLLWLNATFDAALNPEYLLLLGGPFAAAVLAQQATATKVQSGTVQQVPAGQPAVGDLVKDGKYGAITDTQFILFNIVAIAFFVVTLIQYPTELPDLPDTLVGLTSASALTYLGAKVVNANAPVISSVTVVTHAIDGKLHKGSELRILGQNFLPDDAPENVLDTVVLFQNLEVLPSKVTDSEIVVTTPELQPAALTIRVRTAAGVITQPQTQQLEYAEAIA